VVVLGVVRSQPVREAQHVLGVRATAAAAAAHLVADLLRAPTPDVGIFRIREQILER